MPWGDSYCVAMTLCWWQKSMLLHQREIEGVSIFFHVIYASYVLVSTSPYYIALNLNLKGFYFNSDITLELPEITWYLENYDRSSMESDQRRSLEIASQTDLNANNSKVTENKPNHDVCHSKEKVESSPGDSESNTVVPPVDTEDDAPTHQYATPRELSLLSTVFTIATFMIAIDGSILGKYTQVAETFHSDIVTD